MLSLACGAAPENAKTAGNIAVSALVDYDEYGAIDAKVLLLEEMTVRGGAAGVAKINPAVIHQRGGGGVERTGYQEPSPPYQAGK